MIKNTASDFIKFKVVTEEEVKSKNAINYLFKTDQYHRSKIVISVVHSGKGFSTGK
jgi:hypothetical protein